MKLRVVLAGTALAPSLLLSACGSDGPALVEAATGAAESTGSAAPAATATATAAAINPVQRADADRAAKADARSFAVAMEVYFIDRQAYPAALVQRPDASGTGARITGGVGWDSVKLSPGTSASVRTTGTSFCLTLTNPQASRPWVYESQAGGIQTDAAASCDEADGPEIVSR